MSQHTKAASVSVNSRRWFLGGSLAITAWTSVFVLTLAAVTNAAPPLGPTDLKTEEKSVGVTLYQINGFNGSIPLKKKWVGGSIGYDLEFASNNMNTKQQWFAKFVLPDGHAFVNFQIKDANSYVKVDTVGAQKWDGKTLIDKVTLSPWNMENVRKQCVQQLKNANGTFKSSATFLLQPSSISQVRGQAHATLGDPSKVKSYSAAVNPRTRVTAYIIDADRRGEASRVPNHTIRPPVNANRLPQRPTREIPQIQRPPPTSATRPALPPTSQRPQARPASQPTRKPIRRRPTTRPARR